MVIQQIENKILSGADLTTLTDNELAQLAVQFVGDAPPSHIPREKVINILQEQESVRQWQSSLMSRAKDLAAEKVTEAASKVQTTIEQNSDDPMVAMIRERFGKWLQDSGYDVSELTKKLDRNGDGIIQMEEISEFIFELTGNQPPNWVLEHISTILDSNNDGVVLISELWSYLEELGFAIPVIEQPVIAEPIIEQPIIEESAENDSNNSEEYSNEDIVEEAQEQIQVEETKPLQELENTQDEVQIATNIEKTIDLLGKARLHSEANLIIESSNSSKCILKVERVERNLMVNDNYRGGKTLVGLLDGGPFTVAVLFEPKFNELIETEIKKTKKVTFNASLYEWSSGLRQAKLKGLDLETLN